MKPTLLSIDELLVTLAENEIEFLENAIACTYVDDEEDEKQLFERQHEIHILKEFIKEKKVKK